MNNIYSYSDAELEKINAGMPTVLKNLPFLIAPVDDDQLLLINSFLLGGVIQVRREQKRRKDAARREATRINISGGGPQDAA